MEVKSWLKLVLITVMAAFLSGCWDARDINDRNIVTAVVVDKTDYGFAFHIEIPSIAGTKGNGESSSVQKNYVISAEGRTLGEARENLDKHMDKPIYLGAVQTILLTDRLAAYDIGEYMMRLRQLNDYRKTVHVIVTTSGPDQLLNSRPENSPSVGTSVDSTIRSLIRSGQLQEVTMMDVLEKMASPYPHYILPTIEVIENEPTYTGFTLLSDGMKTGFITAADAKPIVFIQAKKPMFEYAVAYKDTYATVQVHLAKKEIIPYYAEGKASFWMKLAFNTMLAYPEKYGPVPEEDLNNIGNSLKAMLETEFEETFRKSIETYHYDCFNLGDVFRVAYPNEYGKMSWDDTYQNATLFLSVSVDISPSRPINYHSYE